MCIDEKPGGHGTIVSGGKLPYESTSKVQRPDDFPSLIHRGEKIPLVRSLKQLPTPCYQDRRRLAKRRKTDEHRMGPTGFLPNRTDLVHDEGRTWLIPV
jgi:hypothetical protein